MHKSKEKYKSHLRLEQWKAEGQKTGKPYLKSEQYAMPVFYHNVMYRENTEEKDACTL